MTKFSIVKVKERRKGMEFEKIYLMDGTTLIYVLKVRSLSQIKSLIETTVIC